VEESKWKVKRERDDVQDIVAIDEIRGSRSK